MTKKEKQIWDLLEKVVSSNLKKKTNSETFINTYKSGIRTGINSACIEMMRLLRGDITKEEFERKLK